MKDQQWLNFVTFFFFFTMTEINDKSSSSLITVGENEAETVSYDIFVENETLNIDTSFEDNLMSEEEDAAMDGRSSVHSTTSTIWNFFTQNEKIENDENMKPLCGQFGDLMTPDSGGIMGDFTRIKI